MERRMRLATLGGPGGPQDVVPNLPGDDREGVYQIVEFLPNKGRPFLDLVTYPTSLAYAGGVLTAGPWRVWSLSGLITKRGLAAQRPHIDQNVVPAAMCAVPAMINVFLCLSDFEAEMGATLIAPGTHLGPRPRFDASDAEVELHPAVAKAGDAIIWEGRTWHGAGPHSSDRTRYAIASGYGLSAVTPNDLYACSLHDRVYETLTPEELAVLGFHAEQSGYSGRIAPRNPFDRRTNVNRARPYIPELRRP
jgi:ectoine hydroxylase-related dioxygenase (phytanoyl-CoA dioxygenase family)